MFVLPFHKLCRHIDEHASQAASYVHVVVYHTRDLDS